MGTRRALLAAVLTTGMLLVAGPAPSAHAQDWVYAQDRGDALVTDFYGDSEQEGPKVVGSQQRGDLTRVSVRHGEGTVRIAVGLRGQSVRDSELEIRILTSSGERFQVSHGYRYGYESTFLSRRSYGGGFGSFTCEGFSVTTTTSTSLVVRVPRTCLDSPYRLRVGAQLRDRSSVRDDRGQVTRYVVDDVLRTGKVDVIRPRLGPWVVGG